MFINRNWNYDEETDYQRNIKHHTNHIDEAVPQYGKAINNDEYIVVGWMIRQRYE